MKYQPYAWQQPAIDHAVEFLRTASTGQKTLYAAPTGSGKSVVELKVQEALGPDCWIITPAIEIVEGMLDKLGVPEADWSFQTAYNLSICTPIRMRNRLLNGEGLIPKYMLFDEVHHHVAETYQQLDMLCGVCPAAGYTASPFRGSPRSTAELREQWGEPIWVITYEEAKERSIISIPRFVMQPLVNDDVISIRNGEFDITSVDDAYVSRLDAIVDIVKPKFSEGYWDRSTIFALPSTYMCGELAKRMGAKGLPLSIVNASTTHADRRHIFNLTEARATAIAHINVVTEGCDLKLRRLVDLSPMMSPVKWLQQLGRITRPVAEGEASPEYYCTNRNLMRHGYLLQGCLPPNVFVQAEQAFGFSERTNARAIGLESLGRLKPSTVKLTSGVTCTVYNMTAGTTTGTADYAVLVHPMMQPIWAMKLNTINEDGTRAWGKWALCPEPKEFTGFASIPQKEISEKQMRWWQKSAAHFGLDTMQKVDRKNFAVLPLLNDLGLRLR